MIKCRLSICQLPSFYVWMLRRGQLALIYPWSFSNQTSAMWGFVQQMSWGGKKEEEIGTYDWVRVAMTGTGKKRKTKKRADLCLSACWSKQFRLSCYWIPPPSPMLLVSCRFLPFDVKVLAPFHFDSHEAVPSIHFESLHISAAEQRCRVDRQRERPSLTSIVVIFFLPQSNPLL